MDFDALEKLLQLVGLLHQKSFVVVVGLAYLLKRLPRSVLSMLFGRCRLTGLFHLAL